LDFPNAVFGMLPLACARSLLSEAAAHASFPSWQPSPGAGRGNCRRQSFVPLAFGHSSRALRSKKDFGGSPPLRCGPADATPGYCRGQTASHGKAAMVAASKNTRRLHMANIGSFTKNENGFIGEIRTLGLKAKALLQAVTKTGEKGPDFRVLTEKGDVEIGAGWLKTSKNGEDYISIKIDDPTFAAPIYANLVESKGKHQLLWSRQARQARQPQH